MSTLRELLQDYLAMRRALGFKLHTAGTGLHAFVSFMEKAQAPTISTDLACGLSVRGTSQQRQPQAISVCQRTHPRPWSLAERWNDRERCAHARWH